MYKDPPAQQPVRCWRVVAAAVGLLAAPAILLKPLHLRSAAVALASCFQASRTAPAAPHAESARALHCEQTRLRATETNKHYSGIKPPMLCRKACRSEVLTHLPVCQDNTSLSKDSVSSLAYSTIGSLLLLRLTPPAPSQAKCKRCFVCLYSTAHKMLYGSEQLLFLGNIS